MKIKRFLFNGVLLISNKEWSLEVDSVDYERAIAYVKTAYPSFIWKDITEI